MEPYCSIAIDFDGTVTGVDVIDEILRAFARPQWQEAEELWEQGIIGSRECLQLQMAMVDQPLSRLERFVDDFSIDNSFGDFVRLLQSRQIPFAIVSDGFQVFIDRLLGNAGLRGIPVLANVLTEERGRLKTVFPYSDPACLSANCKCSAITGLNGDRELIVIGDGRSDFCLAQKAAHVYAKNTLTDFCDERGIPFTVFNRFSEIGAHLLKRGSLLPRIPAASRKD